MRSQTLGRLPILLLAGAAAYASAVNPPSITTFANAHYQQHAGGPDTDSFTFPAASLPVTISSRSYVPIGGFAGYGRSGHATLPDIDCGWDDADAYAFSTVPGFDGAYARSGGYSPQGGSPDDLESVAELTLVSNWVAAGAAATTPVDLLFFLDGFLYVSKNSGLPTLLDASVEASVEVTSSLGTTLIFSTTSNLNYATGFTSTFFANGASSANWDGSWADNSSTLTSTNGVDRLYELNYLENINDIVVVPTSEVFEVKYKLRVRSYNGEGPSELFATSDFSNTSDVTLTTDMAGVTLTEVNLVPEPASMTALGLGALAVLRRRKR